MAGAETSNCIDQSIPATATAVVATNNGRPTPPIKSTVRRFVGVRQRPSGRWVAEIKDSSQRVRLWLGTYDTPEAAARAYDEAARALRGENARTNFAQVKSISDQQGPMMRTPSDHLGSAGSTSDGRPGLSFSSLKAKLSKNLQNIMARARDGKSSKSRVSDHCAFASIFHRRSFQYQTPPHDVDMKRMEKVVQPSIIVPPVETDQAAAAGSWENSSINSDCSSDQWVGFRQGTGLDSDGSDVGEVGFVEQLMGWIDSPEFCPSEVSRSKRLKVSSSVMVPATFSGSPSPYDGCCSPYSGNDSPYHGYGSPYNYS